MSYVSYPALRSILEHLDVNKRLYITARSKNLQKVEKSITLRSNRLILRCHYISINNFAVETGWESDTIKFQKTARIICERNIPKEWKGRAEKIGKVNQYYFGERSNIIANQLHIYGDLFELNLPETFNLKVNELNSHRLSFAQYFSIGKIESLNITSEGELRIVEQVRVIVENYKKNDYLKRMIVTFPQVRAIEIIRPLNALKEEFQRFVSTLEGVDELFIPGSPRYLITLDNNTKIMVFGVRV